MSPLTMFIGKYFIVLGRRYSSRILPICSALRLSDFFICMVYTFTGLSLPKTVMNPPYAKKATKKPTNQA